MSIEFISDEFLEGKKEELDNVNEVLSEKHKKVDKNVLFLRRFTFALMGQYNFHKKHLYEKPQEIEILNKQLFQGVRLHEMPVAPSPRIQIPRPQPRIPAPLKEKLKIPEPIKVENLPKEETKQEKKEIPAPI